jgi:hypothetical protein
VTFFHCPSGIDVNPKSVEAASENMPGKFGPIINSIDICDHQAKSKGTGSDNMNEIAAAAAAGRVETLLIEAAPNSR